MVIDNDNVILVSTQNETITESQRVHIHCEEERDTGDMQTAAPMLLSKIGPADLLAGDATSLDVQIRNDQEQNQWKTICWSSYQQVNDPGKWIIHPSVPHLSMIMSVTILSPYGFAFRYMHTSLRLDVYEDFKEQLILEEFGLRYLNPNSQASILDSDI